VVRTITRAIEVVPPFLKVLLGAAGGLALLFALGAALAAGRARRLGQQRKRLLREVGLLQEALLPAVPARFDGLAVSAAYRPAEGLAAGGDFYDAFPCGDGCVGLLIGDVSGHGRDALSSTTLVRHTVRAYLEGGLEPRRVLKLAARVLEPSLPGDQFATVLAAVYNPAAGAFTYACAGHPPPIIVGADAHEPVTAASAPPIGLDVDTGMRQTTVPFPEGARALLVTDGVVEAPVGGLMLGWDRLARDFRSLQADDPAAAVVARVSGQADRLRDDMAALSVRAAQGARTAARKVEELEVASADLSFPRLERFLCACGVAERDLHDVREAAEDAVAASGAAVVRVTTVQTGRAQIEVVPADVAAFASAAPAAWPHEQRG
jgi:hypothetical protein